MKRPISEEEAILRLQQLCSKSEKCSQDIQNKLQQWGYQGNPNNVIEHLESNGFINNTRYAFACANDKSKLSAWGKNKIRYFLKGKNIPETDIEKALDDISLDDYISMVKKELERKVKSLPLENTNKLKQKVLAFAMQRGYESDLVCNFLDDQLKDLF